METKDLINEIKNMPQATFTVSADKQMVMADTDMSAYQLYNEGVTKGPADENEWPMKPNVWYKIDGAYGHWVLENEFPNTKGGEMINVKYE